MQRLIPATSPEIQNRRIDIATHQYDDDHILVCGVLEDRRLVPTYAIDGTYREPATVHHMRIHIKIDVATLTIEDIEAELPAFPHEECAEMHRTLESIRGLRLSPGFTANVKNRLGGRKGCIHLTTLLLAMAPAALQGYWVHNDRHPENRNMSADMLNNYLIDTCKVWRRDGPLVRSVTKLTHMKP